MSQVKKTTGAFPGVQMDDADRAALPKFLKLAHELAGVQMTEKHEGMVVSRLIKRMGELKIPSISEYYQYFMDHRVDEAPKLIGLLTTHHTFFFREFVHFEYLLKVLPDLVQVASARPDKTLRIWSAACSRGHEVYSLAMFLDFHFKRMKTTVYYEIIGTDVDPASVAIAKNGVYLRSELKEVPLTFLGDHWSRGTGEIEAYVRAKKSMRDRCSFKVGNLMELKPFVEEKNKYDVVFCRNVFIYFNLDQIRQISISLLGHLLSTGYFFVGISESLTTLKLPVSIVGPSIYGHAINQSLKKNPNQKSTGQPLAPAAVSRPLPPPVETVVPIRVLCVDDSPVVLTLLKKILGPDSGFEVVGTAANGIEAAHQVQMLRPDVITLDIHMPEQTGIEYLEKNFHPGHPSVVMVTSVSREDSTLAGKSLSLGAVDYVEKPALSNLEERTDEIRTKLRCAYLVGASGKVSLSLDREFQEKKKISKPGEKLRLAVLPASYDDKLKQLMAEMTGSQPGCVILVDGPPMLLTALAAKWSSLTGRRIEYGAEIPNRIEPNTFLLAELKQVEKLHEKFGKAMATSFMVYGEVSKGAAKELKKFKAAQFVLEDLGKGTGTKSLMDVASDVVLPTSFLYLSDEYFYLMENQPTRKVG